MPENDKLAAALQYAELGWRVFPVRHKMPMTTHGLLDATSDVNQIQKWFAHAKQNTGVGVATGRGSGVLVLDVDLYKPGGIESHKKLQTEFGLTDETVICITGGNGHHYYFRYPDGTNVTNAQEFLGLAGVDIRGIGGYVVAPPTPHENGSFYKWMSGHSPADLKPAACPEFILKGKSQQSLTGRRTITVALNGLQTPSSNGNGNGAHATDEGAITEGLRNETLASVAGTLRNFGMDEEAIFSGLQEVNLKRCVPPLDTEEVRTIAKHITQYPPHRNRHDVNGGTASAQEAAITLLTFDRNDAGFAEMIAHHHGTNIRYNHTKDSWLLWHENFWIPDTKNEVTLRAIEVADRFKQVAAAITDEQMRIDTLKYARALKNRQKLDAGLYIAASQPGIATIHSDWDNDPSVIAALNGVVDLRDGSLRNGKPSDNISQYVNINFDDKADCPLWKSFISDIFKRDEDLINFVQTAVGYSMTGENREQCLFMLIGNGANGKTTFLEILRVIFNSYGFPAPFATFERSQAAQQQSNDLAAIANKRLVMASEPNEGVTLNEGRIKSLTGGEAISARFLHREFFEFIPMCKIWLAANVLPRVVDDSHGFWRRVRMIRFTQQFVKAADVRTADQKVKDPELLFKLLGELPGILNWIVQGSQNWYRHGLQTPDTVSVATKQYRTDSDPLHEFLTQHCTFEPTGSISADELLKAYTGFCNERMMKHYEIMGTAKFHARMTQRFDRVIVGDIPFYHGVQLKKESTHLTMRELSSVMINFPGRDK